MTESIISGAVTGVIMLVIGALAARISLRTRTEESGMELSRRMKSLENSLHGHIADSRRRNEVILESLLAIMVSLKKQREDKNIEEALCGLNDYMINKGAE